MGGFGAIQLYLRFPLFRSCSGSSAFFLSFYPPSSLVRRLNKTAFAPVLSLDAPWVQKAFGKYFLPTDDWKKTFDLPRLVAAHDKPRIKIDIGSDDQFLVDQLKPDDFKKALPTDGHADQITIEMHSGYNHSYYFISTFAPSHIQVRLPLSLPLHTSHTQIVPCRDLVYCRAYVIYRRQRIS